MLTVYFKQTLKTKKCKKYTLKMLSVLRSNVSTAIVKESVRGFSQLSAKTPVQAQVVAQKYGLFNQSFHHITCAMCLLYFRFGRKAHRGVLLGHRLFGF